MTIAVNTRLLINDLHGGIEWFTYECLRRITINHPEHTFYFLFDRDYDDKFIFSANVTPVVLKTRAVHPFLWYYWLERRVSPTLKKLNVDLFLSPDGMMPLNSSVPCLTVIHDINFHHRRKDLPFLKSLYFRRYFKQFAQRAVRIATVSNYSKNDLVDSWNINPDKIDVVYNGVSEKFYRYKESERKSPFEDPYFLFVGNLSPRKNVPNLIRAYNIFRESSGLKHKLVIVGERFFLNSELDREIEKSAYNKDIIMVGEKNPDELRELYNSAEALVFVPWFEGFGIPIVEAMKCGTPVIASNLTSIPEIAGDAALLVDPARPDEIARKMLKVTSLGKLRAEVIEKGEKQAARFSWDDTADKLWQSVLKSLKTE